MMSMKSALFGSSTSELLDQDGNGCNEEQQLESPPSARTAVPERPPPTVVLQVAERLLNLHS
jgi:hypothetical protein